MILGLEPSMYKFYTKNLVHILKYIIAEEFRCEPYFSWDEIEEKFKDHLLGMEVLGLT